MTRLRRAFWLLVQAAYACAVLPWLIATRRGRPLVLTHHRDRDARGRDRQVGPLLDALGPQCFEVALIPARARESFTRLRPSSRPCLPYALLTVVGQLGGTRARLRVARCLLFALRPRVAFLIDESGSGQPWVHAARAHRVRTVGIQHGDFAPGNPQYDRAAGRDLAPVDVLCVWSPWFQARLLAVSAIYTATNTRVTGRLRDDAVSTRRPGDTTMRVLVVGERGADHVATIAPYTRALRAAPTVELEVQPHPAVASPKRDLGAALSWCDVAIGVRSSALLEALWHERPVVIVGSEPHDHDLVAAALALPCADPEAIVDSCRAAMGDIDHLRRARAVVWGDPPADAARAILAAATAPQVSA